MAQIKVIKLNSDGLPQEHGSADDVSFATVTGATQVGVTSGVTLTNNITFNAITDTIAGIQNQNLLDKTAAETISANWTVQTGSSLTLTDAPTSNTDAANKAYVDSVASGLDWQDSVKDKDLTAPPGSPSTGDRYIVATSATGAWSGEDGNIAEWNGSAWVFTTKSEGMATWVEDEDVVYVYNGSAWVKMSSVYNHNDLNGLNVGDYKHLTAAEDTWVNDAITTVPTATNLVDKSSAETISGDWTYTGRVDISGGELRFPSAASGTPQEGDTYWDGTADILYVYDGSTWVNVSAAGTASSVVTTYTAGAGGIAQYDAVYISAADTVLKANANTSSTSKIIGFSQQAISAASTGPIQENGALAGVISGATAGDSYYLDTTAGLIVNSPPTGVGQNVVRVGFAKNATTLQIAIQFMGIRA